MIKTNGQSPLSLFNAAQFLSIATCLRACEMSIVLYEFGAIFQCISHIPSEKIIYKCTLSNDLVDRINYMPQNRSTKY